MGAQDSLDQANEFVETTGATTPLMIWDASFDTWAYYDVRGQPTAVLVEPSGNPIAAWRGAIPVDEILTLASEA